MFVSTSIFRLSKPRLCAKGTPKGPPKGAQITSQPLDLSTRMVFIERITLLPGSGELWEQTFLKVTFRTLFFQCCATLDRWVLELSPKWVTSLGKQITKKPTPSPHHPPEIPMHPRGSKMTPKWSPGCENGVQGSPKSKFKHRNDWY